MSEDDLKALDKDMRRLKRIAAEWASKMHDLVEDRLPTGYEEIPELSRATYEACAAWAEAARKFAAAGGGQ